MLVDSHCHLTRLDPKTHDGDIDSVILAAKENDVGHFLCVCLDLVSFPSVLALAHAYEEVSASIALHPTEGIGQEISVEELVRLGGDAQVVAVGETGLDYHWCHGDVEWQKDRFRKHIHAARELKKPLIIHTREAAADTVQILREEHAESVGGVMHCFTEDWSIAEAALELGFYISFSGIVTFKNAKQVHEVAVRVPSDRILVETDAPYLAPEPHRGKSNEPAFVRYVAERLADLRKESYETIAQQTTENYFRLFGHA